MTRLPVPLVVAVCATTVVMAWQEPQFRSAAHTVSVYTTVVDRDGRLVPDLKREDFEVLDNGKPQPITVFANDVQPITIVVMLDRSGSMASHFELVRDAADHFVSNLLPKDRAKIGSFSDSIRISPDEFTSDPDVMRRILRTELLPPGLTPLWSATSAAMDALTNHEGRRVVLLFTDGLDTPQFGRSVSFAKVRGRSQTEEIMVYGIGLSEQCADRRDVTTPARRTGGGGILFQIRGPGTGVPSGPIGGGPSGPFGGRPGVPSPGLPVPGPPVPVPGAPTRFPPVGGGPRTAPDPAPLVRCTNSGPDPDLRELSAVGGGGYFELRSTDDLASTFARVAEELHHQYLIAFDAKELDNKLHQLEVRVRDSNLRPRARSSYLASRDK